MFRIYYNPNASSKYNRYIATPNTVLNSVVETTVSFVPLSLGTFAYTQYLKNNGMVYSKTLECEVKDVVVDTASYVFSKAVKRIGKEMEKAVNFLNGLYGAYSTLEQIQKSITTYESDKAVFKMFEIAGIGNNSSNLQYLAGVINKGYDFISEDVNYYFNRDIIPGKTLFEVSCEIMQEKNKKKADEKLDKYVANYKASVLASRKTKATDREVWRFRETIGDREKFNYRVQRFKERVLK